MHGEKIHSVYNMDQWTLMKQNKKFTDRVSDSILQVTFKKLLLLSFGVVLKNNIHNYLKNTPLLLTITTTGLSSYTSTKIMYLKRLNAEADMKIQFSSNKPGIKEICRKINNYPDSYFFLL